MTRRPTARLFFAVDPPLPVREELAAWARAATAGPARSAPSGGGLRLLGPELLHLTVCFLGERPVEELAALASVLQECAGHACELSVAGPLWLPPRRPRALAVAIADDDGELGRLRDQLLGALAAVSGWEADRSEIRRRRFTAHITVARVSGTARRGRGRGAERGEDREAPALAPTPRLRFMPEALSLYRSRLGPEGASYEAVAGATLLPAGC